MGDPVPLRFALIAEGGTEKPLVRILEILCRRAGAREVSGIWANDVLALFGAGKVLDDQVRTLIEREPEVKLIFVHRDADGPDDRRAREVINAGTRALDAARHAVALVPIQETEAWMLTDDAAIRQVVGNASGRARLDLPKVKHIEQRASPKWILRQALGDAAKPGRQQHDVRSNDKVFGSLRRRLLEQLDIDGRVNELRAWQQLLADIDAAIARLALPHDP